MELVEIYEGQTVLASVLAEALREKGIEPVTQAAGPMQGVLAGAAMPPFERVLISSEDWETRRDVVEECLMFVRQDPGDPAPTEETDTEEA